MNAFHRIAAIFLLGVLGQAATAQQTGSTIAVKIDAQPMERALQSFARQSGLQVIFPTDLARNLTSPPIDGRFSPRMALNLLLAGTQLSYEFVNDKTIAIRSASIARGGGTGAVQQGGAEMRLVQVTPQQAASAQANQPATVARPPQTAEEASELEVVSTRIDGLNKKSIFQATEEAALPYNVMDREEIARMGVTSIDELFRNIPEITGYGNNTQSLVGNTSNSGGATYSANSVNMNGFGSQQTVVLVNGRRLGEATQFVGPDISRIAIGSIERIEILPAAAAAIYGGGAAGGAINIIMRKEYEVKDLTTYFGAGSNGGGEELRSTYVDGRAFNGGRTRLTSTFDFSKRQPLRVGERDFLDRALQRYGQDTSYQISGRSAFERVFLTATGAPVGTIVSNSATLGLGIPGNPGARYAAIPTGITTAESAALTRNSFVATAGTYNQGTRFERSLLYRPVENYSFGAQLEHALLSDEKLSLFFETVVSYQRQDYSYPSFQRWNLEANHILNPFRDTDGAGPLVGVPIIVYMDPTDLEDSSDLQERTDARVTVGLKGKIGPRWDWMFDLSAQRGAADSTSSQPANYAYYFARTNVSTGSPAASLAERWAVYNPFQDHVQYPNNQPELWHFVRNSYYINKNAEGAFRAVGTPFNLPAGAVKLSPGMDVRLDHNTFAQDYDVSEEAFELLGQTSGTQKSGNSRTTYGAFLEANIPVFSPKWSPLGLHSLDLNLSRRYDDSNRSEQVSSDTLAMRISIVKDVMFRASRTNGFVLNRNNTDTFAASQDVLINIQDPRRGNVSTSTLVPTYITGGNPDLKTEFIESTNYGALLRPRFIPGLSVNVNYFENERLDTPASVTLANLLNFPDDYLGRLVRAPLTASDTQAGYTGGAIQSIDLRRINLQRVLQRGVNYNINYSLPVPAEFGAVDWAIKTTNYRTYIRQVRPGVAPVEYVNAQNQPLSWRGSSSIFWKRGRTLVGVTGNYINSYFASTTAPSPSLPTASGVDGPKIKHQLTFDLQLGYEIPQGTLAGRGWLSIFDGTDLRFGVLNVLDTMPPMYTDTSGFYSRYADPRQRYPYLSVKKNFGGK